VVSARDKSSNHNQTTPSGEMATTPHGPDAWDPADDTGTTATALSAPIPMIQTHGPHMLSSSDLADWYSIRLSAGSSNMFSTPGGTGDNYGELFTDPHGVTRVAFNDDAAGGGQFRFTYVPTVTTTFYLRVRAVWAGDDCAYTLQWMGSAVDPNPPYPDPMRFATLPTAVSPSGVTMTAETATDDSGVEYLFEETTGHAGGESGDWQDAPEFANTNLQPETTYGYRVRARDTSAAQNLTDWSEVRTVTTPPVVPHDLWDPTDDVGAGATSLGGPTPNEQTHGEHTLNGTDGDDWFVVELEAGMTNYIGATVKMGDPVAYLSKQPDGTELYAWDDDSGSNKAFLVQFTPPLSGTYYLRVIPYASSGPCIYTLTWRRGARVSDMTLAEALDTPGEVWGTYGDSNWVPQIDCTHDGIDAARAGLIGDNQTSILAKVVTGAGDIGFWWRASAVFCGGRCDEQRHQRRHRLAVLHPVCRRGVARPAVDLRQGRLHLQLPGHGICGSVQLYADRRAARDIPRRRRGMVRADPVFARRCRSAPERVHLVQPGHPAADVRLGARHTGVLVESILRERVRHPERGGGRRDKRGDLGRGRVAVAIAHPLEAGYPRYYVDVSEGRLPRRRT